MSVLNGAPLRKSEMLVRVFVDRIRSGQWKPGMRLPSERELARQFQVSRTAVREALKALQLAGEIETRLGEGSFVLENQRSIADEDALVGAGQSIVSRLQARQALEIASGVLAIKNASESDRIKLRAVRVELSEALEIEDYQWYLVVTFDLHELIAKISHNSYLEETTRDVVEPMRNDEWALTASYDAEMAGYSISVHHAMIDALLANDVDAFVASVCRHYEDYPALRHPELKRLRAVSEAS
ncbi:FadR/GntR family transcriptional regulator [Propionibacterium australiense]|uniref:GntR bacterial regulatory protein HTH signature n=1 Tax=Propionibacterium australiense TaxID=119981 RepID=A0A383S7K5_9ACTN|nr:GntR family transcriptional regulator [Propionibacterium australiense]RLP09637.1 GntR family transcriptional regulator [Propionibacterium australiense]RLP12339.1 GntR family transcriptional regulator [Propionibacterium australiense]SYZ33542.1 GntR bacterial regulatory protein HTH signature [Propionibacterium australiense]VEH89609.1 L-lactate utilization operon repressor [Propionibacterium australiense]